jgi:solute carrier family 35 protein E3
MNISDVIAWFLNVSSSVIIVFVNKVLLDAKAHGFVFGELCCQSAVPSSVSNRTFMLAQALVDAFSAATTLCGLHFMACAVSIWAVEALGLADRAPLPREGEQCFCVSK